jgi:hypothetical protein
MNQSPLKYICIILINKNCCKTNLNTKFKGLFLKLKIQMSTDFKFCIIFSNMIFKIFIEFKMNTDFKLMADSSLWGERLWVDFKKMDNYT